MQRQGTYLERFWPDLYKEATARVGQVQPVLTPGRQVGYEFKQTSGKGFFDRVHEATSLERAAGAVGKTAGAITTETFRPIAETALGGQAPAARTGPTQGKVSRPVEAAAAGAASAIDTATSLGIGPETAKATRALVEGEVPHVSPWIGVEAASIVPFGKPLRGLRAARAAEKAAKITPAVKTVEEAAAIQQAREGLKGAAAVRTRQEAGYKPERAARAQAAEKAMQVGGVEGYRAALGQLKGELPKLNFGGFSHLDEPAVDHLLTHIQQHKHLRPYQKVTAMKAVMNATQGKVPTRSQLSLLENVFGKEVAQNLGAADNLSTRVARELGDIWNFPRSLMASFDLSAPFRQGLVSGARHPVIFGKNFKPMIKAFGSQKVYEGVMDDIVRRPTYPMMEKGGLGLTEMGGSLANREEQFFSSAAEKLPGVKNSSRAYSAFLNKMRADVFDHLVTTAQKQGYDVQDPKFLKGISTYINSSTGRGDLGALTAAGPVMNSLFFSPRLMMSRFNFLNPLYYERLDPFARKQALRAGLQTVGLVSTVLGLAAAAGARVGTDPRSADFAKVRVGNSRFDIAGGFQQPVRLLSQLASGTVISSTTGKELTLGPQGPGKLSRKDIIQRFFEAKLAPSPSILKDWLQGTNFLGEPFSWSEETYTHMIPLLAQDAYDLYNDREGGVDGISAALGAYGIGAFGIGFQTYADGEQKTNKRRSPQYGKPRPRTRTGPVSNKPSRSRSNKPN